MENKREKKNYQKFWKFVFRFFNTVVVTASWKLNKWSPRDDDAKQFETGVPPPQKKKGFKNREKKISLRGVTNFHSTLL